MFLRPVNQISVNKESESRCRMFYQLTHFNLTTKRLHFSKAITIHQPNLEAHLKVRSSIINNSKVVIAVCLLVKLRLRRFEKRMVMIKLSTTTTISTHWKLRLIKIQTHPTTRRKAELWIMHPCPVNVALSSQSIKIRTWWIWLLATLTQDGIDSALTWQL